MSTQLPGHSLYYYATCPFCIKVIVTMKSMGITIPTCNIKSDSQYRDALVAGGGKSQVPCLRIESDGSERWLYESSDIIAYLKNAKSAAAS